MAEKSTLPPLHSFFKRSEPVFDADPALANMPEIDWANNDSVDAAGPFPPANPTVKYNSFAADKIDDIYSAARESMQIRIYGNRHDGSKVLNGTVTVQLDDDLEPDIVVAYQTAQAKVEVWLARANAPSPVQRPRRRSSAAASATVPAKKPKYGGHAGTGRGNKIVQVVEATAEIKALSSVILRDLNNVFAGAQDAEQIFEDVASVIRKHMLIS